MASVTPVHVDSVTTSTVRTRITPTAPTTIVASHGVFSCGCTAQKTLLTGPGHARSRPDDHMIRAHWSRIAITALRIAAAIASEMMSLSVLDPNVVIRYCIGEAALVKSASDGVPSSASVVGTSSKTTAIVKDHKIALAMPFDGPSVSSTKLRALA